MDDVDLQVLLDQAWDARTHAYTRGRRRVGAAVLAGDGSVYTGCNIQQKYHTGDLHAEVVAIAAMLSTGGKSLGAIAVVSDGNGVAPCGSCLDWILEFGGDDCWVAWEGQDAQTLHVMGAAELMPLHPSYV